jgi:hypothetical protein
MITKRLSSKIQPALSSTRHLGGIPTQKTFQDTTVTLDSEHLLGALSDTGANRIDSEAQRHWGTHT